MTKTKTRKKPSLSPAEPAPPAAAGAPVRELPPVRGGVQNVELELLDASPGNRELGDIEDLTESVQSHGVLQPVLLRPKPDDDMRYETVAGHRRVAAARAAGLMTIPALVRDLDDREVLEVRLIENLERRELHPLEECEGYRLLVERHGYTVEALSARLHKGRDYVHGRLRFSSLAKDLHEAFLAKELDVGQALLVARVAGVDRQKKAWRLLADERLPFREAAELVRREFMLELEGAPFDPLDAGLVTAAGSCALCPKRAGNMPGLFEDLGGEDVCTDSACFRRKAEASFELATKQHKAHGGKVLGKKESAAMFHGRELSWSAKNQWVEVDQADQDFGKKPVRAVLGEFLPDTILARNEDGGPHLLVDRKTALAAAKKAKLAVPALERSKEKKEASASGSDKAAKTREENERAIKRRMGPALIEAAIHAVGPLVARDDETIPWLVLLAVASSRYETDLAEFLHERGVEVRKGGKKGDVAAVLRGELSEAIGTQRIPERDVARLNVLRLVLGAGYDEWRGAEEPLASFLEDVDVDQAKVRAEVAAAVKAERVTKKKAKAEK